MIKAEFWDDEKLSRISLGARLTFIGTWTFSDDNGVIKGNTNWLVSRIFPYSDDLPEFKSWIEELENIGVIRPFQANGEKFYHIVNFLKHQVINRPSKQRNPAPPEHFSECSVSAHAKLTDERESKRESKREIESEQNTEPSLNDFDHFWEAYPKKKSKGQAKKAWDKLKKQRILPSITTLTEAIAAQKAGHDWLKDSGKFIPHPATWLNSESWLDEVNPHYGTGDRIMDRNLKSVQEFIGDA